MDLLRRCYTCDMRFVDGDQGTVPVRWYWCQPNAAYLGCPTAFGSAVYEDRNVKPIPDRPLGEVFTPFPTFVDGNQPPRSPGICRVGTDGQFLRGITEAQRTTVNPVPVCCTGQTAYINERSFLGITMVNGIAQGPPPAGLLWWFRPDEIADIPLGDAVTEWPPPMPGLPTAAYIQALGFVPPASASPGAVFGSFVGPRTAWGADLGWPVPPAASDHTSFWVLTFPLSNQDALYIRDSHNNQFLTVTKFGVGTGFSGGGSGHAGAPPAGATVVVACRRLGNTQTFWWNGCQQPSGVATGSNPWGDPIISTPLMGHWQGPPGPIVFIPGDPNADFGPTTLLESVGWGRALTSQELANEGSRLASRYGTTWTPCPGQEDLMIGSIVDWPATALPLGWLTCDGSRVSQATYPDLFNVVGYGFGPNNGDATFALPDLRGRFSVGTGQQPGGTAYNLADSGGAESVALATAQVPAHNHPITDPGHTHGLTDPGHTHAVTDPGHGHDVDIVASGANGPLTHIQGSSQTTVSATVALAAKSHTTGISDQTATTGVTANSATTGISTGNTGGGGTHENRPPYLALQAIIRAL